MKTETKSKITEMIELYKKGLSMQKIGERLKMSSATVHKYLKQFVPLEERRRRKFKGKKLLTKEKMEKIKNLYLQGFSSIKLSRMFGVDPSVIIKKLKEMGIDTSKGGKYAGKITEEKLQLLVEIYKRTGSIVKTAKYLKLHPSSVYYRLKRLKMIKPQKLDHNIVKKKYELFTQILCELFKKLGYKVLHVQRKYNQKGPDMIVEKDGEKIIIEHKATVKNSFYWKHAIEEAKKNMAALNINKAIIATTAKKPKRFINKNKNLTFLFFEDLFNLLQLLNLQHLENDLKFISNTPSL